MTEENKTVQAPVQNTSPAAEAAPAAPAPAAAPVVSQESQPAPVTPDKETVVAPKAQEPTTVLGSEPAKTDVNLADKKADSGEANAQVSTEKSTTSDASQTDKTDAKTEAKSEDAKKDATTQVEADKAPKEGEKKEEAAQSAEPAPLPTYEPFKFAEGITPDEKGLGLFTNLLGELELAKGDHAKTQEVGQKLVDYYVAEQQANLKRQSEYFIGLFEKQKTSWKEAFMSDAEIGGERWEASANAAKEFIRSHGGTDAQQKELRQLMESTGVGNHPAMIRIFAKAMKVMSEGKPLPAIKPEASMPKSKIERRYGKMT